MNKSDLIKEIAKRAGVSKKDAIAFYDAFQDAILDAVRSGEDVALHGLMKIERKIKKGRRVYDFQNSCSMVVGDREVISIRPGLLLEECI